MDFDLEKVCFEGPDETLNQTQYTQPCMVAFATGVTEVLQEKGVRPSVTAGLSLGEYSALHASGVLDPATAIELVAFRGKAMAEAVQGRPSAMAAIFMLGREELQACCDAASHLGVAEIANLNCPGQIVIGMIANYVAEHKHAKGCIFDGFPRTTVQAEEFDKILAGHGLQVDIMIDIHVPEEELIQRILLRGKDSGRADDASEEVIRGRLDVYRQQTAVVSDYYAAQGKYASVNGTGTMDDVFARITDVIAQL